MKKTLLTPFPGVQRGVNGGTIRRAPKSPNNATSTLFNAVHLLAKGLKSEHGVAKFASCRGCHPASLRPCPLTILKSSGYAMAMGGGTFFKVGAQAHVTKCITFLWFTLITVKSQVLKYDVISRTPYEGLIYTILDQVAPPRKRIGEPPGIKIGCYRGDSGQQRHSGSSYD